MSIYNFKPKFQNLLRPIVRFLAEHGITANQVTMTAMVLSLGTGIYLTFHHEGVILLLVPLVMFVRMALNAIDGMLAKEFNMKSNVGLILNEMGDVISDAALYLPFALIAGLSSPLIVVIVIWALLTEMAGILATQIGASRRYDGPMGKSDRAVVFSIIAVMLAISHSPTIIIVTHVILMIVCLLLGLTVGKRLGRALAEVK